METLALIVAAGIAAASGNAQSAKAYKEKADAAELAAIHEAAIETGLLGARDLEKPPPDCVRLHVCIGDLDPSPAAVARAKEKGIDIRKCADRAEAVPTGCSRVVVRVLGPMTLDEPVEDLRFTVEGGAVPMQCRNPLERRTGPCYTAPDAKRYCPTTKLMCDDGSNCGAVEQADAADEARRSCR
jgi:hypothetical protein